MHGNSRRCYPKPRMIRDWIQRRSSPSAKPADRSNRFDSAGEARQRSAFGGRRTIATWTGVSAPTPSTAPEAVPLDLFILLDRSGSMSGPINTGTKWSMIGEALGTFVNDPASAGIQVALTYFSQPVAGQLVPNDDLYSCLVSDYVQPAVTMDGASGQRPAHRRFDPRPRAVGPHAYQHRPRGSHQLLARLGQDGIPLTTWPSFSPPMVSPKGATRRPTTRRGSPRRAFAGTPSIATYVIGVGGGLEVLQPIAAGGGTSKPFLINNVVNATQDFIDAMYAVRVGQGSAVRIRHSAADQ